MRTPLPQQYPQQPEESVPSTQRARADAPRLVTDPQEAAVQGDPAPLSDAVVRPSHPRRRRGIGLSTEDTLLSLPPPADRADVERDEDLIALSRRIADLTERVRLLENAPRPPSTTPANRQWLIWAVFLLALGITWQLLRGLR